MQFYLPLMLALAIHAFATPAQKTNLFVSSYRGFLSTTSFTETTKDASAELAVVDENTGCAPSPAWLYFDHSNRILYCFDEGLAVSNGSASSYQVTDDGFLTLVERRVIPSGPSGAAMYTTASTQTLAVSHYNASALTIWNTTSDGILSLLDEFPFTQDKPGPGPRQTAPHQHQVVLDPTGQFLVLNEFGRDRIQVFHIDTQTDSIAELKPGIAPVGSGPRHGVFWSPEGAKTKPPDNLYYFVIGEIDSSLTSFAVTYPGPGEMAFQQVDISNTYGGGAVPPENGPAEIHVSPDNNFILVSNRNSTPTHHASLAYLSSVEEYWDNIATFRPLANGSLVLEILTPSGGGFPRNFAINQRGDRVAVALQSQQRVVVMARDAASGEFGDILANITIEGEPNCLVWDQ